jgi:TRAP transporter TAXI family solute receptor
MKNIDRRGLMVVLAASAAASTSGRAWAQSPALTLATAGAGSAFLPYGQGIAQILAKSGITIAIKESKGSNENLDLVDASPGLMGTAFLGSALDALNGTGFAGGRKHANVRALFPMYETAFMAATLAPRGLISVKSLDGKKVGCGPAAGPAEDYFRAAAEIAGIKSVIVGGTPAGQTRQLLAGEIDAFWQGAFVPIPSLVAATNGADCTVFGLDDSEIAGMKKRFAFMADAAYPAATYRGQKAGLKTVAAWNVVIAHKDLDEKAAYTITKAIMTAPDISAAGPAAASTKPVNATKNTVVPYHPGAVRALAELGVKL